MSIPAAHRPTPLAQSSQPGLTSARALHPHLGARVWAEQLNAGPADSCQTGAHARRKRARCQASPAADAFYDGIYRHAGAPRLCGHGRHADRHADADGALKGKYAFDLFTHARCMLDNPSWCVCCVISRGQC